MYNELNLQVLRLLGEPVNNTSRVIVSAPIFNAVKQSKWARKNNEKPMLNFTSVQDANQNWIDIFTLKGVNLYTFTKDKKINFFMNVKQAEACLVGSAPFDVTQFNLNTVAVV